MKKSAVLAALACTLLCTASASADVRFRGAFTLTKVENCIARYPGETFNSTFRPAGLPGNPDITSLTEFNAYSGDVYELPGKTFKLHQWEAVKGYGVDNLHYEFDARIKIVFQHPKRLTEKTSFVSMAGVIENFGSDPGSGGTCVASFRGSWFRRVE